MLVFEGVQKGAREIVDTAYRLLINYTSTTQDPRLRSTVPQTRWCPPPIGSFKVNVDSSTFEGSKSVGIGVIVRDSEGQVIATETQHIHVDFPRKVVEAMGVHFAVHFVRDLGLTSVVVKGDNLEIINAINIQEIHLTSLGLILDDI
ncbi:hypothetical protein L1049_023148 [Liquidambar formosana]|uniref:RNase H type-1 domain-containing protein n=1 Tax=Liquidambar formosana TaxID=63359 RepID=A0AAP0WSX1_LIQFO